MNVVVPIEAVLRPVPTPEFLAYTELLGKHEDVKKSHAALLSSLQHMQGCRSCAEGAWSDCEEGRAAEAAIKTVEALGP